MEDLLTANPDKGSIAGVWGAYDLLVSGATEAVRRADRNEIKIASIDGDRIGFQMLLDENSPFVATVVQDVPAIGRLAAEALVSAVGGKKDFPSAIFTEVYIATHANGVKAAEKRWGAKIWDDLGIAKADVENRWPQTSDLVVVRPILP
jgi:ABC-type sugar transport system substrate-binding protein